MKATSKTLRLKTDTGTVHEFRIRAGAPVVAGRGDNVGLRVDVPSVSREHCRFEVAKGGEVSVVDLESHNGTSVNGKAVQRAALKSGDRIEIGAVAFTVEIADLEVGTSTRSRKQTGTTDRLDSGAVKAITDPGTDTMRMAAPKAAAAAPPASVRDRLAGLGLEVIEAIERPGGTSGGGTQTFRARRRGLEDEVIVKAVLVSDSQRAERLLREARLASKARHRNIVQIHDVREEPGLVAIVLEKVEGRTLAQEVQQAGRVSPARALEIGAEVCRALAHAHKLGVIHRNVTPQSIVLAADGSVKLTDFGLAKSIAGPSAQQGRGITMIGQGLGQPQYAAPEQRRDATSVDARADIYSLGATLYHALGGKAPVVWLQVDQEGDAAEHEPDSLHTFAADVPQPVRAIVGRCMRPKREARYRTADELLHAMEGAATLLDPRAGRTAGALIPREGTSGFSGRVQGDELVELLQSAELNRKSGYLELFGEGQDEGSTVAGTIVLREGRIAEARSEGGSGRNAAMELLLLKKGSFSLVYTAPPEIEGEDPIAIGPLLMEVCRRRDEGAIPSE